MESVKLNTSAYAIQILTTFCICFLSCETGMAVGWPSATIELFQSNSTVLSTPMTSLDISLLGSLMNVGSLASMPLCSYTFNTLGRKYGSIIFGLAYVIAWAMIYFSKNVMIILTAITIAGIGLSGQTVSWIYISEISHDSIRGSLTASAGSAYFLGILFSYILGGYLTYYQAVFTNLAVAISTIILLMMFPESPVFLVLVNKEEEAAKSIAFYNQIDIKSKEVQKEIKRIKIQLDPRLEAVLESQNDPKSTSGVLTEDLGVNLSTKTESSWKILKRSKSSKRALMTVVILMSLSIFMGCVVLQIYAEPLFKEAVPTMSPNFCSILLAIDNVVACVLCVLIIDKFGRRNLNIVSALGSAICTLLLGTQLHLHWAPHWVTMVLIYTFSFVYTLGCAFIPFVLNAEVFLPEVRTLCSGIVLSFLCITSFITLFIFYPLVDLLGLGVVFCCFSAVCIWSAVFTHFCLPETTGLSVDAIQALFLKKSK